jgi:hypothetical protein
MFGAANDAYKRVFLAHVVDVATLNVVLSHFAVYKFEVLLVFASIINCVSIAVHSLGVAGSQVGDLMRQKS